MHGLRGTIVFVLAAVLGGCLDEPPITERWTNLEILASSENGSQPVDLASGESIQMRARITYRSLLTGAMVAELRASDTLSSSAVRLDPEEEESTAAQIDFILQNSVTAGRDIRSSTGFPSLIREYEFDFDSFDPGSTALAGPVTGLFLVLYFGDEDEIRLASGQDSVVITPYPSVPYEILHKGIAIPLAAP